MSSLKYYKDNLYENFKDPSSVFSNETRGFFYDIATDFISKSKENSRQQWYEDKGTIKGILLLLFTWNFAAKETKKLNFQNIAKVIQSAKVDLISLEKEKITTFDISAYNSIERVFDKFKPLFGQTGTSKALSLLNPCLFVMWDTAIRKRLKKELIPGIENGTLGKHYVIFLKGIQGIIKDFNLESKLSSSANIAKKIDEYNYVRIVMDMDIP